MKKLIFLMFLLLISMFSFSVFAAVPTSPAAYWKFETTADSSGNGFTLNPNSVTNVVGKVGNGSSFNGVNSYYDTDFGSGDITGSFTVCSWIRWNGGDSFQEVLGTNTGSNHFNMWMDSRSGHTYVRALVRIAGVDYVTPATDFGSSYLQTFHSYCIKYNSTANKLSIHTDGSTEKTYVTTSGNYVGNADITLGRFEVGGGNQPLNGVLDEVMVFTRALTNTEMTNYFTAGTYTVSALFKQDSGYCPLNATNYTYLDYYNNNANTSINQYNCNTTTGLIEGTNDGSAPTSVRFVIEPDKILSSAIPFSYAGYFVDYLSATNYTYEESQTAGMGYIWNAVSTDGILVNGKWEGNFDNLYLTDLAYNMTTGVYTSITVKSTRVKLLGGTGRAYVVIPVSTVGSTRYLGAFRDKVFTLPLNPSQTVYETPIRYTVTANRIGTNYTCGTTGHVPCGSNLASVTLYGDNIDLEGVVYTKLYDSYFGYKMNGSSAPYTTTKYSTDYVGMDITADITDLHSGVYAAVSYVDALTGTYAGQTFTYNPIYFKVGARIANIVATGVTANSVTLNMDSDANDTASIAYAYFRYRLLNDTNTSNWSRTPEEHINGYGTFFQTVTENISVDNTYIAQGIVKQTTDDVGNVSYETGNVTFTTSATTLLQVASTRVVSNDNTSMVVSAYANSSAGGFDAYFGYKRVNVLEYTETIHQTVSQASVNYLFNQSITGLLPNTSYNVRGCIERGSSEVCSPWTTMSTNASTSTDIYSGNVPQTATSFWALVLGDYNNAFYKAIIGFLLVIVLILAGAYFFGKYNQSLGTMGVLIFFFLGVVISTVIGLFSTGLIILMLVGSIVIIIVKTMLFPSQGTG
jgi:hypothetical protein